jgi:hypothetical protein
MGHKFLVAAYCCTWAIQLGYVAWMALKWRGQREKIKAMAGLGTSLTPGNRIA